MLKSKLPASLRVILVGGTSHAGKSAVAMHLANALMWEYQSTDKLARHPGRPWRSAESDVPEHVREHYSTLPVDALLADVLRHYEQNVLPKIEALVRSRADPSITGLVLEGSALWPAFVEQFISSHVFAVWITASDELIHRRIHTESRYVTRSPESRALIDKFLARSLAYNKRLQEELRARQLPSIHLREDETLDKISARILQESDSPVG